MYVIVRLVEILHLLGHQPFTVSCVAYVAVVEDPHQGSPHVVVVLPCLFEHGIDVLGQLLIDGSLLKLVAQPSVCGVGESVKFFQVRVPPIFRHFGCRMPD